MKIEVSTGERWGLGKDWDGNVIQVKTSTATVSIGGILFVTECSSDEDARRVAAQVSFELGLPK